MNILMAYNSVLPLPFAVQVLDNPRVAVAQRTGDPGILIGQQAIVAAGAQSEFVAANMIQAKALGCCVILRAGEPPQYNKERSPKSGINLSKTSKQGFFKGAIAEELRFARLMDNGEPLPHHAKDAAHLLLSPIDPDYQHTMQLDLNMHDILREVGPNGDLQVLGYDHQTGYLRLEYKEGCGPHTKNADFNGQFVINILAGEEKPIFYSREWDSAWHDPNWDVSQSIIKKPPELASIPDEVYKKVFNHKFFLHYTESKHSNIRPSELKAANVFANRPRSADEFRIAMGKQHPQYDLVESCKDIGEILLTLKQQVPEQANRVILDIYNKSGSIIAGDWDGLALGHPPALDLKYTDVIDGFAPQEEGIKNRQLLMQLSEQYLTECKAKAHEKLSNHQPINAFEEKLLSVSSLSSIVSQFALERAGCVTVHEFVYQQVLNDSYRDKLNQHYGERYNMVAVQAAMDKLVSMKDYLTPDTMTQAAKNLLRAELAISDSILPTSMFDKLVTHMVNHYQLAVTSPQEAYVLPHIQYDMNVHDLYQHGFDMRNPYGSNLEGAWFLITADGTTIYGYSQEQLIEVLLTGDFLVNNHIDISHGADMASGWSRVIERQIELKQLIPEKTMDKYRAFKAEQQVGPEPIEIKPMDHAVHNIGSKFTSMKQQLTDFKSARLKQENVINADDDATTGNEGPQLGG
ncbi:MAG: hypothetical protein ACOVQX_04770 [Legionella sp.]